MEIKKYPTHIVFHFGKKWVSVDKTGIMVWTGTRNLFYIYKKDNGRNAKFFHN